MRTRRLFGLTLVVLILHGFAWQLGAAGRPRFALPTAGVRWLALVRPAHAEPSVGAAANTPAPALASGRTQLPARLHVAARPLAGVAAHKPEDTVGARGAARASALAAATPAWPVYATRAPPTTTVHYRLAASGHAAPAGPADVAQRAPPTTAGEATLEWVRDADAFSLRLATAPAERPAREWRSSGTFDAAGVAPVRLVQRERGRDTQAINFDRDGGRVRFSGASGAPAFAPGAQDRWSWVAQLAAIAEAAAADGRAIAVDTRWDVQVAGLRGELDRWSFRVLADAAAPPELQAEPPRQGNDVSSGPDRAPVLLHVLRDAERPYDLRIEAWLSPSLHHLPAGLRMSTPPGSWSLSLWQRTSDPSPGS
jgi:hypothetical protein